MTDQPEPEPQTVPLDPPYGGPTDGEWCCRRCWQERVGCALCAGKLIHLVRSPHRDR